MKNSLWKLDKMNSNCIEILQQEWRAGKCERDGDGDIEWEWEWIWGRQVFGWGEWMKTKGECAGRVGEGSQVEKKYKSLYSFAPIYWVNVFIWSMPPRSNQLLNWLFLAHSIMPNWQLYPRITHMQAHELHYELKQRVFSLIAVVCVLSNKLHVICCRSFNFSFVFHKLL